MRGIFKPSIEAHALQLHTSLVAQLPPVLRVYINCGLKLYGDPESADLIKIHIRSGKLTLMRFDDFLGKPLPRLIQRVKLKLREQDFDVFDYGEPSTPPFEKGGSVGDFIVEDEDMEEVAR